MKWKSFPRWLRDALLTTAAMSALLILYNLIGPMVSPKSGYYNWAMVPLQIIVALIAVSVWSYFSYRSQEKRRIAAAQKKAETLQRQQAAAKAAADRQARAAAIRARNTARNQQHQQLKDD